MEDAIKHIKKYATSQNLTLLGVFLLAIVLISNTMKAIETNYQLQIDARVLEEEIAILELENANLELLKQYYETDEFAELESRRRFGTFAEGETRIVFPAWEGQDNTEQTTEIVTEPGPVQNLKDWWDFFF